MPIRNEQMFRDAWKELGNKKSKLNREKLKKLIFDYIEKNEPRRGEGIQIGQEALKKYLRRQR